MKNGLITNLVQICIDGCCYLGLSDNSSIFKIEALGIITSILHSIAGNTPDTGDHHVAEDILVDVGFIISSTSRPWTSSSENFDTLCLVYFNIIPLCNLLLSLKTFYLASQQACVSYLCLLIGLGESRFTVVKTITLLLGGSYLVKLTLARWKWFLEQSLAQLE